MNAIIGKKYLVFNENNIEDRKAIITSFILLSNVAGAVIGLDGNPPDILINLTEVTGIINSSSN